MVRTIVTPKGTDLHLTIEEEYVGKQIEITYLALEELTPKTGTKTMADFLGMLSKADYTELKAQTEEARKEWDRNF